MMRFSMEDPYWKNKTEQLMIQLGLPESERQRISGEIFAVDPENKSEWIKFILNEAEPIQTEIESVSPHADDQDIHEALQKLPFALKAAVVLTVFHHTDNLQKMISTDDYEEGLSRLSDDLHTDKQQTLKLLNFIKPAYDKIEMPESRKAVPENNVPAEEKPAGKQKTVKMITSAVLVTGLLSVSVFLLNDPPVPDDGQSAGEEETAEDESDNEKAFTDEEIEEFETKLSESRERLKEALSLTDEELDFLMVTQQAESHISYIRGMMKRDAGISGPDANQMKQMTADILSQMQPPMIILQDFYEKADGVNSDSHLIRSDQAVSMFLHAGPDFLIAYERKLNHLIHENNYSEAELRENHSDLFNTISANGMEVSFDKTDEQLASTVYYGGAEFISQTDYLHPDYQQFLTSLHEIGSRMGLHTNNQPETLTEISEKLLEIEDEIAMFFNLQDSVNDDLEDHEMKHELHVPFSLSFQYIEQIRSIVSLGGLSLSEGTNIPEEYREIWRYILSEEKFEGSMLRKVVSLNQRIAEDNNYELLNDFGEISISPFSDYIDPMHYFSYSTSMIMPLSGYLEELYKIYVNEGYESIEFLHPQVVVLFYLQALETGDIETAYSLMGGEDLPDYDTFAQMVSEHEYDFKRLSDVMPTSSSDQGMEFQVQQRNNTLNITVIESEDWYDIKFESADQFEKLATEGDTDAPD